MRTKKQSVLVVDDCPVSRQLHPQHRSYCASRMVSHTAAATVSLYAPSLEILVPNSALLHTPQSLHRTTISAA